MRISYWSSDVCSSDRCAYLRVDMSAAQILTRRLQVIHPYGTVGALPWQGKEPVIRYGQQFETADLLAASRSLRTFTEGSNDPQRSEESRVGKECDRTCRYRWSPCT